MEATDVLADITDTNVDSTMLEKMIEDFLERLPSRMLSLGVKILFCIIIFLIGRKLINLQVQEANWRTRLSKWANTKGMSTVLSKVVNGYYF